MNKYTQFVWREKNTKKGWALPALSLGLYMFVVVGSLVILTN